jgi:hypothetical protein
MPKSAIDSTAVNAVDTLFKSSGPVDPWRVGIARRFVDAYIFSDSIEYPIAANSVNAVTSPLKVGPIMWDLESAHPGTFHTKMIELPHTNVLEGEKAQFIYNGLSRKLRDPIFTNKLKQWWLLHQETALVSQHGKTKGEFFLFSQDDFRANPIINALAADVGIGHEGLAYTLDVILKYIYYGQVVSEGTYYLSHVLRESCASDVLASPTWLAEPFPATITFSDYFIELSKTCNKPEFLKCLAVARDVTHNRDYDPMRMEGDELEGYNEALWSRGLPPVWGGGDKLKVIARPLGAIAGAYVAEKLGHDVIGTLIGAGSGGAFGELATSAGAKKIVEQAVEKVLGGHTFGVPRWALKGAPQIQWLKWTLMRPVRRKYAEVP